MPNFLDPNELDLSLGYVTRQSRKFCVGALPGDLVHEGLGSGRELGIRPH